MNSGLPGGRRALGAAAIVTGAAGVTIAVSALVVWDTGEATAVVALVMSIIALALACAGLAAYTVWLRRAVSRRMVMLLRPYLELQVVTATTVGAPPASSLSPVTADAAPATSGFVLLSASVEN